MGKKALFACSVYCATFFEKIIVKCVMNLKCVIKCQKRSNCLAPTYRDLLKNTVVSIFSEDQDGSILCLIVIVEPIRIKFRSLYIQILFENISKIGLKFGF